MTSNERAYKWSVGANAFGVLKVSAQSGFSTNVTITYKYGTDNSVYYICGNDQVPTAAHRVFACG